jgi:hypothetical protein
MRLFALLVACVWNLAALSVDGPLTVRGTVGAPLVCAVIASSSGGSVTYDASGLPAGLAIDPVSGRISGTPTTASGADPINATVAIDDGSSSANAVISFTITAAAGANVTNAAYYAVTAGSACSIKATTAATTPTWTATGLPSGLTISADGLISGTPAFAETANVEISADGDTTATTMVLHILDAALGAPTVTIPVQPQAAIGVPFACWIHASGATDISASGRPAWLSLNTSTGLLSGTPTSGSTHINLRVTASVLGATATTVLAVPVLTPISGASLPTSPASIEATVGSGITWKAIASSAATWSTSGLPGGMALDTGSGVLSGSPATDGLDDVLLTATNLTTSVVTTLAIRSYPATSGAPILTASGPAALTIGAPAAIAVATSGDAPTTFSLVDPGGDFTISNTGLITGTPDTAGAIAWRVTAANSSGSTTSTLMAVVFAADADAPLPGSPVLWTATADSACAFQLNASSNVDTWSASGLPLGMSLAPASGLVSGIPTLASNANLPLSATSASGSNTTHAVLRVAASTPDGPRIADAGPWLLTVGQAAGIALIDTSGTATWTVSTLPAGLVLASNGVISGTPTATGTTTLSITASRSGSATTTGLISISAATPGAPVITSPTLLTGAENTAFTATITATNAPFQFGASPLPSWMSLNPTTGVLSGVSETAQTVVLQVSAGNASGTTRTTVILRIGSGGGGGGGGTGGGSQVGGISGGGCGAGAAGLLFVLSIGIGCRLRRRTTLR